MEKGDFIEQKHTETFALIIDKMKNGSFKVLAHDFRNRVIQTSTKGWWPVPVVIEKSEVPEKVLNKIEAYQNKKSSRRLADITRLAKIHVKANGPVSMNEIVKYVKWQYGKDVPELLIHKAVSDLNKSGEIEPYDNLTWW